MALDCNTAFGRYLRMLRERRTMSLDEVASLSRSFADSIDKGYLSRCENGKQRLAFAKMIALSRIYEVPPEVLVERMELDMELDRVGGPETDGKSFAELYLLGKENSELGVVWDTYGYFREASFLAHGAELFRRFRDKTEQILIACMAVASSAIKLGKARFACHELEYIRLAQGISDEFSYIVLDRLAVGLRDLEEYDRAREYSDEAIARAEASGSKEFLGYLYGTRARLAAAESDPAFATELYQRAFKANRESGNLTTCAKDLVNLAHSYMTLSRYRSARRALAAADRLTREHGMDRTLGFVRMRLGEIEELQNKPEQAIAHWREAIAIAKKNSDRILRFCVELHLYRHSLKCGKEAAARAIERRLRKLAPWIPGEYEEVREFRELLASHKEPVPRRVVTTQPPASR